MGHNRLRIGKLTENKGVPLFGNTLGNSYGSAHAFFCRGEHKLCAQPPQQVAALDAHGFGHGQHTAKASHRGHQGHAYAHIAACGLHQHPAGFNPPFFQRLRNKIKGHAILDGTARVAVFKLQPDSARQVARKVKAQQRGIADGLQNTGQHENIRLMVKKCLKIRFDGRIALYNTRILLNSLRITIEETVHIGNFTFACFNRPITWRIL